jgi:hypothetical protein
MMIDGQWTLVAVGYVVTFMAGRGYQVVIMREREGSKASPVEVSVPARVPDFERDDAEIDSAIAVEAGDNVQELQASQRPQRKRRQA